MKITLLTVGKKDDALYRAGVSEYSDRLQHYVKLEWKYIQPKTQSKEDQSQQILSALSPSDNVVLLDETGIQLTSLKLADKLQTYMNQGTKNLVFIIGGAYGVSKAVFERADFVWSLSELVFPHQLVRLILAEQLYRAHTILANENYHHN